MVHGGLRYLQNFDLGLVREALLERQLMVQLAPHLVYPTPFLVPTLGDDSRDRMIGIGLNMYDVMATTRVGQARRERAERARAYRATTGRPTATGRSPARRRRADPRARRRASPKSAYLFYDCQTDDVRLVLTILGEAERFGAVMPNRRRGHLPARRGRPRRRRRLHATPRPASTFEIERRQRDQRDRRLGRPDPPRGDPRRGRGAADRAQPRDPRDALARQAAARPTPPASSRPARTARSSPCPGTAGR